MVASSASLGLDRSDSGPGVATASVDGRGKTSKRNAVGFVEPLGDILGELHAPADRHRLRYLPTRATMGRKPWPCFRPPEAESYWDDFAVDVLVVAASLLLFLLGLGVALGAGAVFGILPGAGILGSAATLVLFGPHLGSGDRLVHQNPAGLPRRLLRAAVCLSLLHRSRSQTSARCPAPHGEHDHRQGVPGLIWSEDFVMRDATGILFLDYRQPLRIWEWLFGLFRAGDFTGKSVEVVGWFRRAPVPPTSSSSRSRSMVAVLLLATDGMSWPASWSWSALV